MSDIFRNLFIKSLVYKSSQRFTIVFHISKTEETKNRSLKQFLTVEIYGVILKYVFEFKNKQTNKQKALDLKAFLTIVTLSRASCSDDSSKNKHIL